MKIKVFRVLYPHEGIKPASTRKDVLTHAAAWMDLWTPCQWMEAR